MLYEDYLLPLQLCSIFSGMARELGVQELEMKHLEDNFDQVLANTVKELEENGKINMEVCTIQISAKRTSKCKDDMIIKSPDQNNTLKQANIICSQVQTFYRT